MFFKNSNASGTGPGTVPATNGARPHGRPNGAHGREGTAARVPSVIADGLNILGNLFSDGDIDIDGKVEGDVKGTQVTIRSNGQVKGDLTADYAYIHGEVNGVVRATHVYLYKTSRIEGVILHETVSIEDGAQVNGQLKRLASTGSKESEEAAMNVLDSIRLISNAH